MAADLSLADSATIVISSGNKDTVIIRLKLSDTADILPGVVLKFGSGLMDSSMLNSMTLKTYKGGALVQTFNGSPALSMDSMPGGKQCVSAVATSNFNEIQLELKMAKKYSKDWDISVFHAEGHIYAPLPLKILSFNVENVNKGDVNIKWEVAEEVDCKGYDIMYSSDGVKFEKLSSIDARNNRMGVNEYSYTHLMVRGGDSYYYIQTESLDGKVSKSGIIRNKVPGMWPGNKLRIFPNPASNSLTINSDNRVAYINVYNCFGELVYSKRSDSNIRQEVLLDIGDLGAGVYFINAGSDEGSINMERFIKY